MKLSDYIVAFLAQAGVKHVFAIIGHGNMHIFDSLAKSQEVSYVCTQHEQAAATAAEAYSKVTENLGAALVTSGPGGTNTVTGVAGAWLDSVPVIYMSGQVNYRESIRDTAVRQFGVQEINIIDIIRPITKYAVTLADPKKIRYHLERALYEATHGRPGPVWLDIPLDFQYAEINPEALESFIPPPPSTDASRLSEQVVQIVELIRSSRRPVIIAGAGIKRGHAIVEFQSVLQKLKFPVVTTYSAANLLPYNHPLSMERGGVNGTRAPNLAMQNADLILALGTRLHTTQTSSFPETYARAAKKVIVDIDRKELDKNWVKADVPVCGDVKVFMELLSAALKESDIPSVQDWIARCQQWKHKYPARLPEYDTPGTAVNSYVFIDTLSDLLDADDLVIHDMGTAFAGTMQAFKIKPGQYLSSNYGLANMGYALPACIGTWFGASRKKRIVEICGDGGLQMSIGELQTIMHYKIPLKLFVLNNHSYLTIKHTQEAYFSKYYAGSTPESGYSVPNFVSIARAYGLATETITNHAELSSKITTVLNSPGAILCNVEMIQDQPFAPKLLARKVGDKYMTTPLEDMYPFLPREEFRNNMLVEPLPESK